ncbi:MAG: hypothetical protein EOM51_04375 [Clostridia bacterium]|nr:hypothetical protein [Clostridia bacterium]
MKKIFNKFSPILRIIIYLVISTIFVSLSSSLSDGTSEVLQDSFILSFLGVFAGLAIACISFIFANIEKIRDCLKELIKDVTNFDYMIENIVKELKRDTYMTVYALVICFFVILLRDVNVPIISFICAWKSKQQIFSIIEVSLLIATLGAITDIMKSLFGLFEVFSLINKALSLTSVDKK